MIGVDEYISDLLKNFYQLGETSSKQAPKYLPKKDTSSYKFLKVLYQKNPIPLSKAEILNLAGFKPLEIRENFKKS